ncbi:unnamed protein product [Linum trigynum]|uniref:Uncharacterized protein n=1 Tax=Linum trigynum TaxID=586398 RepID=A0AAV2FMZ4_9ROSI
MDDLRPDRSSTTHFGLPRALDEVRKIKPKRTLFTSMMHLMDHEKLSEYLMQLMETEGLDVQLYLHNFLFYPVQFVSIA